MNKNKNISVNVIVNTPLLRIRQQPRMDGVDTGNRLNEGEIVTINRITETSSNGETLKWGRLVTGGWICLKFTTVIADNNANNEDSEEVVVDNEISENLEAEEATKESEEVIEDNESAEDL